MGMVRGLVALLVIGGCGFSQRTAGDIVDDAPPGGDAEIDAPPAIPACAKLALGSDHSCALRDGAVYCWGSNGFGTLGGGSQTTAVTLPLPTIQLASAKYHVCAVAMDGTVRCWGYNDGGQLGLGVTGGQSNAPMLVSGMTGAVQVQTGRTQSCARRANGTVRCWGANSSGQLGDGTFTPQNTAVADVMNVTGAVDLQTTSSHVCVRNAAGAALCWGDNGYSQLGDTTTTDRNTPIAAPVTGVSWIGTASFSSDIAGGHTCAIVGGTVRCWGDNAVGQLGNGTTDDAPAPVTAAGITDAVQVVMGRWHVCARHATGRVSCWGRNLDGEVGDNSQAVRTAPFDVGLTDVLEIGAGGFHTCAITKAKELYCWGLNSSGQLGLASGTRYLVPTKSFALCP
jgi:alpha-tubulin suppressor-like RCC1 family protein